MIRVGSLLRMLPAVAALLMVAVPAKADSYIFGFSNANNGNQLSIDGASSLTPIDQGWYFQNGTHTPSNPNYIVGQCPTGCSLKGEYHNWFAFDISNLSSPVSSLSFTLFAYSVTLSSGNYYLNDYTGSVESLVAGTAGVAGFNDLGGGLNIGFRFYQDTESNQFHTFTLNAAAVSNLNAAIARDDRLWAFGGSFTAGDTPVPPEEVPEPTALALVALSLGGLAARRRRA